VTAGPSENGASPEHQKRAERVSAAREPSQTYRDAQTIAADSTRDAQQPRQRKGADESSQKSQSRTSAGSCDVRCESSWQSRAGRSTTGTDLPVRAICAAAQSGCINCRTKADQSADPRWQITHLEHMVWAHMRARPRESNQDPSCRRQRARGSAGDVRMSESDWGMARRYKSRALSCRVSRSDPRVRTARATSRKVRYPFECKDPVTAEGPAQLTPERRALVARVSAAGRESKHTRNVANCH
jgi:hypothetical protein